MSRYRTEVTTPREIVWSTNALEFDTVEEATAYAFDLLSRWFVPDVARVVTLETPARETVDLTDPRIVVNYRSAS